MSNQNNIELKEKAKKYVLENRWDYLLVHAYLNTQYFSSWSKEDEFEEKWNIGLKNISSEERLLECGYLKETTNFLVASYNDINFKLGGYKKYSSMPDGDTFATLSISLLIEEKVALSIRYSETTFDAYRAEDYRLIDVEEMHSSILKNKLLEGIETEIEMQKTREELRRKQEENDSYKGKFTFE